MQLDLRKIITLALCVCSMQLMVACQSASTSPGAVATPQPQWSDIEAAGKIVVGTSADYPPFSYYTSDFQIDGFDVALMRAIGQRLNVEVVFKDFAFEGLLDALQLNQIDAAIAALSVTPDREKEATFTQIYYVGEDAILARADDPQGDIRVPRAMSGRRVGVQNGSVYEAWVQQNLVDARPITLDQMHQYGDMELAISDLKANRVDLVLLDAVPAQLFLQSGGLKLAGEGLVEQKYAIALPKNDDSVAVQINRALTELQNDGVIAQLAQQYLAINAQEVIVPPTPAPPTATPIPTDTPVPTATTTPLPPTLTPTPECIYGMSYVVDLNLDDHGMTAPPVLSPSQGFTKGWRVQNSGTCAWDPAFTLTYIGGNTSASQMGGQPVAVGQTVAVNGLHDFQVNLIAPVQPGTYQGFWQMRDAQGIPFGERVWVGIQIPGAPTATPTPAPPSTNINFTSNRARINLGESVVFSWDVSGVKAVYFYEQGTRWEENGVAGQGRREVWPQRSTTYELRVVKANDAVEVLPIRIEVIVNNPPTPTWTPPPAMPIIYSFTVSSNHVDVGSCVSLRWDVGGSVNSIRLSRSGLLLMDNAAQRQYNDCLSNPGEYIYVLEVSSGQQTVRQQQNVVFQIRPQPR